LSFFITPTHTQYLPTPPHPHITRECVKRELFVNVLYHFLLGVVEREAKSFWRSLSTHNVVCARDIENLLLLLLSSSPLWAVLLACLVFVCECSLFLLKRMWI
jgi:hypothetical protein